MLLLTAVTKAININRRMLRSGLIIATTTTLTGAKECLKREVIGHRENNVYDCTHPLYSECCERNGRFTCCEVTLNKSMREQLQLWGLIAAVVVVGILIYTCMIKDRQLIESDTLKDAFGKMSSKFRIGKPRKKEAQNKYNPI